MYAIDSSCLVLGMIGLLVLAFLYAIRPLDDYR